MSDPGIALLGFLPYLSSSPSRISPAHHRDDSFRLGVFTIDEAAFKSGALGSSIIGIEIVMDDDDDDEVGAVRFWFWCC